MPVDRSADAPRLHDGHFPFGSASSEQTGLMEHSHFDPDRTVLGAVFSHAGEEEIALTETDRLKHLLVVGKTGNGLSSIGTAGVNPIGNCSSGARKGSCCVNR